MTAPTAFAAAVEAVLVAHRVRHYGFVGDHGPATVTCICGWSHTEPDGAVPPAAREAHIAARIAKGIEALRDSDQTHTSIYQGDGVYGCACGGFILVRDGTTMAEHYDAAALAAFVEASR